MLFSFCLTLFFLHVLLQNLSNEEQVVVIHARTVLTLAEKVTDSVFDGNRVNCLKSKSHSSLITLFLSLTQFLVAFTLEKPKSRHYNLELSFNFLNFGFRLVQFEMFTYYIKRIAQLSIKTGKERKQPARLCPKAKPTSSCKAH